MRQEPIIISDAVYTRCGAIQHDKSLTVNCLVLFMTTFKCPVDRLNLLCCDTPSSLDTVHCSATKQLLVCTRSLWNRIRGVCSHICCCHLPSTAVSFVFGQFGESLTNTNLTSRAFAITWTWRHLYKRGWVTWMEMIPDRRCSIWFPNKVHRSSRNTFAECRINCIFLRSNLPI